MSKTSSVVANQKWIVSDMLLFHNEIEIHGMTAKDGVVYLTTADSLWEFDMKALTRRPKFLMQNEQFDMRGLVSDKNFLYICERNRILKWDIKEKRLSTFCGGPNNTDRIDGDLTSATFDGPTSITMDRKGDLYVSETEAIRKINMKNKTVETIVLDKMATGIVVDKKGTIYFINQKDVVVHLTQGRRVSWIQATDAAIEGGQLCLDINNSLVISHPTKGLHKLNLATHQTFVPLETKHITNTKLMTTDDEGSIFVYVPDTTLDQIVKIQRPYWMLWKVVRLLWIGRQKEGDYCGFYGMPRDVLLEIIQILRNIVEPAK